jgi:hypothetical protein
MSTEYLNCSLVKQLLGGAWPNDRRFKKFDWDAVYIWKICAGGYIIPFQDGDPISGPMLKLHIAGSISYDGLHPKGEVDQ